MGLCINVSGLSLEALLRAIMDIGARAISLADRPQPSHLGHRRSHAPGRPILHRRLKSSPVRSAISPLLARLLVLVLAAPPSPAQIAAEPDRQAIANKFARLRTT
jgi:hypothetical protein